MECEQVVQGESRVIWTGAHLDIGVYGGITVPIRAKVLIMCRQDNSDTGLGTSKEKLAKLGCWLSNHQIMVK